MRPRFVWLALTLVAFSWSSIATRGDQPPASPVPHHRGGPPETDDPADDSRMSAMGRLAHLAATGRLEKALEKARGRRRGQLEALHAAEILEADLGGDDDADLGPAGGQAETSIAVDGTGMHIVVGFNDTRGFSLNPVSVSGFMYSDDGGVTFTDGGQLPTPGNDTIGATKYPQVFGDPEIKYLGGSTFVYFSIMVRKIGTSGTAQTMCVHRSTDNGHTWQGPFEVPPATNPHGQLSGANARDAADKEFADADPDPTGRVMMSWSNFTSTTFAPGGVEISTTFSDNLLTATPPTWATRQIVGATAADGQASIPRFAGHGSNNVYVAWRRFPALNKNNVGFAVSIDNGVTFATATSVASDFKTMDQVLGNDRVNTSPSLAVDNSNGPNQGTVYVVYSNNDSNDGADVMFQARASGASAFSAPVAINSRPGNDRAQWFPWVTVDNSNGRVYAFYYDQRIPMGDITEVSVQHSDDGGASWSPPMSLPDRPFHAGHGNDTGQPNLGDYNQAVAQSGSLLAVWAGTKLLPFTDGLPSASMTTPDVVFRNMPGFTSHPPLALPAALVTFTDGHNNFIDPGDLVSFTIWLSNYATNTLYAATLTSISATLSTSTPGVSVVQATRSYPNIAPGTLASNTAPFVVQVDQSFAHGTNIEFSLTVTTAQGSTTLLFTQSTGTPIATTLLSENFDSVAPGVLPAGWATSHAGGTNTVAWTTSNTFMVSGNNAAFHINANDATNPTRFERLFTPVFSVPANAEYVTLDFDVKYNTEDDPNFNVLAYDGFLLRVTDFGPTMPPAVLRSVLAEAFAEELTTGAKQHYPKHFPRNNSAAYFQDMSAWAGTSSGVQHVHMKLPGMAGRYAQLRWEYTQDSFGICTDVRPGTGPCGVAFDNLEIKSVITSATPATSTIVTSSQNPSDSGEPVTFTATVTAGTPVTNGTVVFKEGATTLAGPLSVDANGQASFTTPSPLSVGSHTIKAEYTGTGPFPSTSSGQISQVVDPLPTVSIDDVSVAEGNADTTSAVFHVTLSASTHAVTASVDFASTPGTATPGVDYADANGSLLFAPGDTMRTVAVAIIGDNVFEPNETFVVNLSNAGHATIGDGQGAGTIVNDDAMPTIAINDVSVVEGNAGTTPAVFTVSLSNPSSTVISVDFATADGSATTADNDYVASAGTLSFAPGETTHAIAVTVNGDNTFEPNETFFVNLSNATHAAIGDPQAVGTIVNDDNMPTIAINDVSVAEGNSGTTPAVFTVSLSNPSSSAISVSFATADGTATTANDDYVAASGAITFAPHETAKTVTVTVNGDFVIEPNETFSVNVSVTANASIADGQGVGTIVNDDTVASTLGTLVAQVGACSGGLTSGQCQALSTRLAAAQRDLAAGRTAGAVHALEQFINEVQNFSRSVPGNGNPPRLDPATAAVWIAEAQSIIAALTS